MVACLLAARILDDLRVPRRHILVVLSTLNDDYGSQHPLSYATWMAFCVPLMLLNTVIAWLAILLIMRLTLGPDTSGSREKEQRIKKVILARKEALGRITMHEVQVVILFLALILLWFFQSPRFMPGWADAEVSIQKTWNCVSCV